MYSTYRHINLDSAESFLDKHLDLQEYLFNLESDEKIKELRELYDIEKTQKELANKRLELSRQSARTRMFLISGGTVILMLIGLIIFYAYRQKLMQQLRKKDDAIHNQQVNEIMRTQELSVLNARVEGQDMERQRIAEDLHDRLGSKLSAVKLYYDSVENEEQGETISKARVLLDETIDETRRIAHNLSSGVLAKFGLIAAIHNLKETLENTKKVEIEFIAHNFDNHEMSKELEENFYRIIQELISNILKHAHASHISIQLTRHEDMSLTLMIEDNGIGFNPQNVSLNSMGLTNLKNRVERFHGSYTVDSEPGHGTTVIVEIDEEQKYTVS